MKENLWKLIIYMALIGMLAFGYLYLREMGIQKNSLDFYENLREAAQQKQEETPSGVSSSVPEESEGTERRNVNFDQLSEINSDIIGWIWAPDLPIDYPVVQGTDNSFYMNHMFNKEENPSGSIFLSYDNSSDFSDDVSSIYGHHIKNNSMFTSLTGYKDPGFYREHPVLYLETKDHSYEIRLFAGYLLSGKGNPFPINFKNGEDRQEFIYECIGKSTFTSETTPGEDDRIVILCTCTYEFEDARYAVAGYLVER